MRSEHSLELYPETGSLTMPKEMDHLRSFPRELGYVLFEYDLKPKFRTGHLYMQTLALMFHCVLDLMASFGSLWESVALNPPVE